MNENIDLTKILKDCPKGWKFYSSIYGDVEFVEINSTNINHPIIFKLHDITHSVSSTVEQFRVQDECTFFPSREQLDWSKFTAPWLKKERFNPKTLEPKYRPFKTQEECWNEMMKHQPFGWLKDTDTGGYIIISELDDEDIEISGNNGWDYVGLMKCYTFADGTPFGIKDE